MHRRGYLVGAATSLGVLVAVTGGKSATVAALDVAILETNEPVPAGGELSVDAEVTNVTDGSIDVEAVMHIGEEPVGGRRHFTLEAGDSRVLTFGHRTFPVRSDVEFPVQIATDDAVDERTVTVTGVDDLEAAATHPDSEVTIAPGTTVRFEVETAAEYGGVTHWYLEGEYAGWSMGPWNAEYASRTGRDYWSYTFDDPGSYTVRAAVEGDGEVANATAEWSVTVDGGAAGPPAVEATAPAAGSLEVPADPDGSVTLDVDVADPEGELASVTWWLGHADVILGQASVSGETDTATLDIESALCHGCPIHVWVSTTDGRTTSTTPWTVTEPDGGPVAIAITDSNDPLEAGDTLLFDLEVTNEGASAASRDVSMVVGGEVVDHRSVTVEGETTESLELGYETYPVRTDVAFPVRVDAGDDAESRSVQVFADGVTALEIDITETNAPVGAGDELAVTAAVENVGTDPLEETVHLVAGDRVDSAPIDLGAGDSTTLELAYETYPVPRNVEFPVAVKTTGASAHETVRVYADYPPALRPSIVATNDPVDAGDRLEVDVEVRNAAAESERGDLVLLAGGDVVDDKSVTVDGDDAETVTLGYDTYPVQRDVEFPVRVEIDRETDERTVEVVIDTGDTGEVALDLIDYAIGGEDPDDEYVTFRNEGETEIDMTGWRMEDDGLVPASSLSPFEFPSGFTLEAGGELTVVTGESTEDEQTLSWGIDRQVWSEEGDVLYVINSEDETILESMISGDESDDETDDEEEPDDDDEDTDPDALEVDFVDCSRVEVSGSFADGDTIAAHTIFNTESGVGTTTGEDFITIGDEVSTPFEGTVVFEVGDDAGVTGDDSSVTVTVANRGVFGTAITGITEPDAVPGSTSHSNPADCTAAIAPELPSLSVDAATGEGDSVAVTFGHENPNESALVASSSFTQGTASQDPPNELPPGSGSFETTWHPDDDGAVLEWTVDLSAFGLEESVSVATDPASAYLEDDVDESADAETPNDDDVEEDDETAAEETPNGDDVAEDDVTTDGETANGDDAAEDDQEDEGPADDAEGNDETANDGTDDDGTSDEGDTDGDGNETE